VRILKFNNIKENLLWKIKLLKLHYWCAMYWLFKILKNKNRRTTYFAKIFAYAADMKIIGNRAESISEYDL
jgi:hypothetical protein